jgi:hypothetical protein
MKVESLEELTSATYPVAIRKLKEKRAQKVRAA